MSLIPAMFQYIRKMVGANDEKQIAFAPLATPFTNEDFIFLNSEVYQTDPAKYYEEALEFSQKANSIIKQAGIWEIESEDFLYDKYDTILSNARLIENRDFTQEELDQQTNARKVLYEADNTPTAAFKSYRQFEEQCREITSNMNTLRNNQPGGSAAEMDQWNRQLQKFEKTLKQKEFEWKVLGFKNQIENAISAFDDPKDNADRDAFVIKWQEAKTFLQTIKSESAISGGEIYPMGCIPNSLYKFGGSEWAKVNLDKAQIATLGNELKQNTGSIDVDAVFGATDIEPDSISFEICRVILARPWYKEHLLLSKYWDYPGVKVSSGKKTDFTGLIPGYPTEFILVKNVIPVLAPDGADNEVLTNKFKTGVPVFVGPFLLQNATGESGPVRKLRAQTFTSQQLKVLSKSAETEGSALDNRKAKKQGLRYLQSFKTTPATQKVMLSHQPFMATGLFKSILSPALGPTIRTHGPIVRKRAGFVWVNDHWERERAPKVEPTNQGVLSGQVVDENNSGIAGAEINILNSLLPVPKSYMSNDQGVFRSESIAFGTYHLTAKKEGYSVMERDISLSANMDMGKLSLSSKKPVESFLLLGVVYKKLPMLPDPIPNEKYS